MKARSCFLVCLSSVALASLAVVACGDDDDNAVTPPKDGGPIETSTVDSPAPDTGGGDTGADADAGPGITTANVVSFDPAMFELPEALSFRDNNAYVSLVASGQIVKIAYPAGTRSLYAQIPGLTQTNFTLGNAFDAAGNLYVGVAASNPGDAVAVAAAGVYKITVAGDGGTTAVKWASAVGASSLKFPNGLSFDAAGNLYVTDPAEGAIYKFTAAGTLAATPWKADPTLAGDQAACPGTVQTFPLGANGIVAEADDVWAVNTDKGTLVRVVVNANGTAGAATAVANDCAKLEGVDGIRPDPRNPTTSFLATNNSLNSIVSISRTGQVAVVTSGKPPFYSPADLAHVTGTSNPTVMLVVNASFAEAFAPADAGLVAKPSLVKLSLP